MFFGAVSAVGAALDRIGDGHRLLVVDLSGVTLVDSSAANMIEGLARKARRQGVALYVAGAAAPLRRDLLAHGARPPLVRYAPSIDAALAGARRRGVLEGPAPGAAGQRPVREGRRHRRTRFAFSRPRPVLR